MRAKRILLALTVALSVGCWIEGRDEYNEGVAAFAAKEYDTAILHFNQAKQKNPELAEAWQGLAECYVLKQRLSEAQAAYREAKRLYDAGYFQDTAIDNDQKKARVDEQLDWIDRALSIDAKIPADAKLPP